MRRVGRQKELFGLVKCVSVGDSPLIPVQQPRLGSPGRGGLVSGLPVRRVCSPIYNLPTCILSHAREPPGFWSWLKAWWTYTEQAFYGYCLYTTLRAVKAPGSLGYTLPFMAAVRRLWEPCACVLWGLRAFVRGRAACVNKKLLCRRFAFQAYYAEVL